ncbi:AI-2E family transporter [Aureimonas flava]|uniref:AI-2E family transporter n=1 Tax=Aureimonas flava TaxID=2320271 RepID=A0A3A1WP96_9HYPH|nr:AI-2E family transporter [Aureimonas flava]RIY03220.1 AI-2E family transporter [Aureimonas flava]
MNETKQDPREPAIVAPAIGLVNRQTFQAAPRRAITGIFLILLFGALYLAASFVLPVVFALLFMLVLSPVVRFAQRKLHIWPPLTAAALVFGTFLVIIGGFSFLTGPLTDLASNVPRYIAAVNEEVEAVRERLGTLRGARIEASQAVRSEAAPQGPQSVILDGPRLLNSAALLVPQIAASIAFALIFLFFLLSSGSLFYQKLIESLPKLSDKKLALTIAHEIETELSRYLFTITLINAGLGVVIGTLMWAIDLPMAPVFGVLAFALNFIPYLGAIAGMMLVGLVGLAEHGEVSGALLPVLLYLAATTVEGQFLTPILVGRRLAMNAAAIFLAVAFWGWIWGVVGMFLAVPIMVGLRIVAGYVDGLKPLANFLSAERHPSEGHDDAETE